MFSECVELLQLTRRQSFQEYNGIIPTENENNSSELSKYLSVLLPLSSIANAIYGNNHSQIENLKLKTSCCELKRTDPRYDQNPTAIKTIQTAIVNLLGFYCLVRSPPCLPSTLPFQIKLMKSNLDSAQNDFLLKEGPRQQQSVDIHARNCISFNSISAKGFTRPLPGHSVATLFKEILTEIIFCKLVSFPTTFEKESLCIPVLENSILMQF